MLQHVQRTIFWDDSDHFLKLTTIDLQAITQLRNIRDAIFVEKVLFKNFSFNQVWECLDLIQMIQTDRCLHAVIQGPPGIGKSHGIWAVSCCHAASGNSVVHVFMEGTMFTAIIFLQGKDIISMSLDKVPADMGLKFIEKEFPGALLVVDGAKQSTKEVFLLQSGSWVLVTSSGLRFTTHEEEFLSPKYVNVDSWRFQEYTDAIMRTKVSKSGPGPVTIDTSILQSDAQEVSTELIDFASTDFLSLWLKEKYFFAGGSVRYMFAFSLSRVIESVDKAFKSQENISQLFGNEDSVADTSIGALRQCLDGNYFLLSQYVTRLLVERQDVTYQLIDVLKGKADEMENGAFKGWIHELDMLTRLKQCMESNTMSKVFEITLIDEHNKTEELVLKFKKAQSFYHENDIMSDLNSDKVLLQPKKFNQGCYDAAVALLKGHNNGDDVLLLLQATVADSHSFKSEFITKLLLQFAKNTTKSKKSAEGSKESQGDEDKQSQRKSKKLKMGDPCITAQQDSEADVLSTAKLCIWHCFILETDSQLEKFGLSGDEFVGIRSHYRRSWQIKTKFWKAVMKK